MASNGEQQQREGVEGITNAAHLKEDELRYEYEIRGMRMDSVIGSMRAANVTAFFDRERADGINIIESLRMKDEEFDQGTFDEFIKCATDVHEEIQQEMAFNDTADRYALLDRLIHYYARLNRYPVDKVTPMHRLVKTIERTMALLKRYILLMPNAPSVGNDHSNVSFPANGPDLDSNVHNSTVVGNGNTDPNLLVPPGTTTNVVPTPPTQCDLQNTGYVPTRRDISVYASARTPHINWSAPPAALSNGYIQRNRMASTQLPVMSLGSNDVTQFGRTSSTAAQGRPPTAILLNNTHNVPVAEPVSTTTMNTKMPGSDLRSLKQFLSNRMYDGMIVDKMHMGVEDFILALDMYARSSPDAEATIMRNMASLLQGKALRWWSTQINNIHTFGDFVQQLRGRFATYTSDRHGLIAAVYDRKQQKDESLADFVDEMLAMMANVSDTFDPETQIRIIVRNSSVEYQGRLVGHTYATIGDFTNFANELSHIARVNENKTTRSDKKQTTLVKKIHATEVNQSGSESENESEDERSIEVLATVLKKAFGKKFGPKTAAGRSDFRNSSRPRVENGRRCVCNCQPATNPTNRSEVNCYGCGAPGVYKNECVVCQSKGNAASTSKNELPSLSSTIQRVDGQ